MLCFTFLIFFFELQESLDERNRFNKAFIQKYAKKTLSKQFIKYLRNFISNAPHESMQHKIRKMHKLNI